MTEACSCYLCQDYLEKNYRFNQSFYLKERDATLNTVMNSSAFFKDNKVLS